MQRGHCAAAAAAAAAKPICTKERSLARKSSVVNRSCLAPAIRSALLSFLSLLSHWHTLQQPTSSSELLHERSKEGHQLIHHQAGLHPNRWYNCCLHPPRRQHPLDRHIRTAEASVGSLLPLNHSSCFCIRADNQFRARRSSILSHGHPFPSASTVLWQSGRIRLHHRSHSYRSSARLHPHSIGHPSL